MGLHEHNQRKGSGLLASVLYGFFSNTLDFLQSSLEAIIQEQQEKILKKLSVIAVLFAGAWFLLHALALFVSEYLGKGVWVGYAIVGAVLVLLGLIFRK